MVPPVYPVIASVYPVLKELSGPKNMLSDQYYSDCTGAFFVSTDLSGAKGISFIVLRILAITLYPELSFR